MEVFKKKLKNSEIGFTLIEILVAMAVFSVVILISVGVLLFLFRASNNSHAILTAINNLDYAMEQMSRTMRVGHSYYCADGVQPVTNQTEDCPWGEGKTLISFTDANQRRVIYKLDAGEDYGYLMRETIFQGQRKLFAITAPEIRIDDLRFNVTGSEPGDGLQPRISIRIKGSTIIEELKDDEQVTFDLQTMVSSRNLGL